MGDRANVYSYDSDLKKGIYLYTHWGGEELPFKVKKSLILRERWDDQSRLSTIILCEMMGKDADHRGIGVSTEMPDNEHPIIVVDCAKRRIGFANEGSEPECYQEWSFEEYIDLNDGDIKDAFLKNTG